jgi:hypothetical protein
MRLSFGTAVPSIELPSPATHEEFYAVTAVLMSSSIRLTRVVFGLNQRSRTTLVVETPASRVRAGASIH